MGIMDRVRTWAGGANEGRADSGEGVAAGRSTSVSRAEVLNSGRASNDETPRSAAVAAQLGWAEIRRGQAAKDPEFSGDYKAAARGNIEAARDANSPGGVVRVRERAAAERGETPGPTSDRAQQRARAFVSAEITRSAGNRQARPKQGEGQQAADGDGRAKRPRMSQSAG